MKKIKSAKESKRANSAGNTNQSPTFVFAQTAKIAPIRGPMMKPNEKAIPTKACNSLLKLEFFCYGIAPFLCLLFSLMTRQQ
jgi:hypothetical protein